MDLIKLITSDVEFGYDLMRACSIKTPRDRPVEGINGLQVNVLTWFSHGNQVGPIMAYFGHETDIQLIWPYRIKEPRLYQSTIKKALPIIKKTNHSGYLGLRCIVSAHDQKPYGTRWVAGLGGPESIATHVGGMLKVSYGEWAKWLKDGVEGSWLFDEFHYKYSGSIIEMIGQTNAKLLGLRAMAYEIPFNPEDEILTSLRHEVDHLHRKPPQEVHPEGCRSELVDGESNA